MVKRLILQQINSKKNLTGNKLVLGSPKKLTQTGSIVFTYIESKTILFLVSKKAALLGDGVKYLWSF